MCIKSMSEHCLIKKNTPELRKKLEDAGLSVCICTTFEDADALAAYAKNPKHVAVADTKVRPFTANRACMDFEV